jgi:outer membrane protein TolC
MNPLKRLRIWIVSVIAGMAIAGCAVGPDFHRPEAPNTDKYTPTALPQETAAAPGMAGTAQRFVGGQDIPVQWWTLFHSEELDQLVRQALAASPTLEAAKATLRQGQENLRAQTGARLAPAIDVNVSGSRQRASGAAFGQPNIQGYFLHAGYFRWLQARA